MSVFGERYVPGGSVEAPDGELIDAIDSFHARPVALLVRVAADSAGRDRLAAQTRALMSLPPHPNVSTVRDAFFAADRYVVVMDRAEGQTLAALLASQGEPGLPVPVVLRYLEQLAAAVDHLHRQQPPVVHGDVRPERVMVTAADAVLLMFAGTGTGAGMAGDVAGFAATAVQLLTGSRPAEASDAASDAPMWAGVDPDAAKHLGRILRRALDPDAAPGPGSAGVLVGRMRAWRSADLPTGAVTFLLTDIEGSTALWEAHSQVMASVIARHHEIVADCVEAHDGRQPRSQGEGDSTLSVFARPADAVGAALAVQRALQDEPWAEGIQLRVRAGLHTGEAEVRGGDYFGAAVSRTARIRALARGSEVLLSQATAQLAMDRLPAGAGLGHVGRRALKGLSREEEIYQLRAPGLVDTPLPAPGAGQSDLLPLPVSLASRSPMIGRRSELGQLQSAWDDACNGAGSVVLVAGEPGIGKTRLAAELAEHVHTTGGTVLHGRCYEENLISYQPFREAIRQYADATPTGQLREDLTRDGTMLIRLVPELLARVPDLPAPVKAEPDTERYLLFEAVVTMFTALSARAPVLLVIDDLHWADHPTALLTARVARACPSTRVMMLGTYRSEEVAEGHPLTAVITSLRRERGFRLVPLLGLPLSDVSALVRAHAGSASDDLVDAIAADTGGNPYFVSELTQHLAETGALNDLPGGPTAGRIAKTGLPDSVREVIERRLRRLSEQTRWLMTLAAVVGREFDLDVLESVSDAEGDVLDHVEEAMRLGAVVEAAAVGRYVFAHALIYGVLYRSLSGARRARLHLRIGDVLESLRGSDPGAAAELAYHFLEAASLDTRGKAVDYSRRAGAHALEQLAHEDAARWFGRALGALGPGGERVLRCDLLLELAEAYRRAGDGPALLTTLQAAAADARSLGDPERLARAAIGSFSQGTTVESNDAVIALLKEALEALPRNDSMLRARVLAALAVEQYFRADRHRVIELSDEAVAVARRLNDPATLARILYEHQIAIHDPAHVEERLEVGSEILELAQQVGDAELTVMAHNVRVQCLIELGEIEQADRELAALDLLTAELRRPYFRYVALLRAFARSELAGDLDQAERLASEAFELGSTGVESDALTIFGIQLYAVRYYQGRLGELVEACADLATQYPDVPAWRLALAMTQAHRGALGDARAEFDVAAAAGFDQIPFDNVWGTAVPLAAEVCAAVGDADRAAELYELLLPYKDRFLVVTTTIACHGAVARYLGLVARTMGRLDTAVQHFHAALAANRRIGAAAIAARTACDYAATLLLRGAADDRTRALSLIADAKTTARRLALADLERELDELEFTSGP
jgi:class 3 adenylate cyclase/tetratricopeptide (TPR) repeat protein